MHVLTPHSGPQSGRRASRALGAGIGLVLFGGGLLLAYLTLGTPFLDRAGLDGWGGSTQPLAAAGLALAVITPGIFVVVGLAKLVETLGLTGSHTDSTIGRIAGRLNDDYVALSGVRLPDGRRVAQLVVGPFGVAIVEVLPAATGSRRMGQDWERRTADGSWAAHESPLDRASRDAETVRRWILHENTDFAVKLYAAVVAPDQSLPRTPSCAVVTDQQLPQWLASLPRQRGLTPPRRARLLAILRQQG